MRLYLIIVIAHWLISTTAWFIKGCFLIGLRLGSGLVWLFKSKKSVPQVDPTKDANSVKSLLDE